MKTLILILFILLIPVSAYAWESYAFQDGDDVRIINIKQGASLQEELVKIGKSGVVTKKVTQFPPREDRDFWKLNGSNLEVDQVKKKAYEDKIKDKKQKKKDVLTKISLTENEWEELTDKEASSVSNV